MRGADQQPDALFSYVSPEQRVPQEHPLRPIREMADEAWKRLSPRFAKLYASSGRPSIAPEKLLRALLLQVLYSVRSERMLMEQLFVGVSIPDSTASRFMNSSVPLCQTRRAFRSLPIASFEWAPLLLVLGLDPSRLVPLVCPMQPQASMTRVRLGRVPPPKSLS